MDNSKEQYDDHLKEIGTNWTLIAYTDPRGKALRSHFQVSGFPCIVIIDPKTAKVVRSNAR